jgi:hypothetical protein
MSQTDKYHFTTEYIARNFAVEMAEEEAETSVYPEGDCWVVSVTWKD